MHKVELEKVKEYFRYLSSVPHGSGNTKQISDLVVKFAADRALKYYQDEWNNVIVYKEGSKGYENAPVTILQAHLDMVCAKKDDNPINMSKTPITIIDDGEWIYADETSLGGDDISGCAIILAVLDDSSISHPPIEAVFTSDEETGMYGANGLDYSKLKGKMMINLDSENLGEIIVGCAGGTRVNCSLPVERREECGLQFFNVTIDSLLGGHSGNEIDKERGHSHFLMARMLDDIIDSMDLRIADLFGGRFDNVIPCETHCVVAVHESDADEFLARVKEYGEIYSNELALSDPDVRVTAKKCEYTGSPLTPESTKNILSLLVSLPYGVINRNLKLNMVQTSLNMGFIKTEEKSVNFAFLVRSNVLSQCNALAKKVIRIAQAFGASAVKDEGYPCWEYVPNSKTRDIAVETFEELYSIKPNVLTIHAGLECGIFSGNIKGLDCVSIGPNIYDIHSPKERMNIDSVDKLAGIVCGMLERIK